MPNTAIMHPNSTPRDASRTRTVTTTQQESIPHSRQNPATCEGYPAGLIPGSSSPAAGKAGGDRFQDPGTEPEHPVEIVVEQEEEVEEEGARTSEQGGRRGWSTFFYFRGSARGGRYGARGERGEVAIGREWERGDGTADERAPQKGLFTTITIVIAAAATTPRVGMSWSHTLSLFRSRSYYSRPSQCRTSTHTSLVPLVLPTIIHLLILPLIPQHDPTSSLPNPPYHRTLGSKSGV
ncbi:hypothetical protein LTR86_007551 [Recurvomyces mirabilis]|nr:hypothetical protein LTR86_007551 [Recurvomyces mirabilis]